MGKETFGCCNGNPIAAAVKHRAESVAFYDLSLKCTNSLSPIVAAAGSIVATMVNSENTPCSDFSNKKTHFGFQKNNKNFGNKPNP